MRWLRQAAKRLKLKLPGARLARQGVIYLLCISILVGIALKIRWPATEVKSFRNEDVAGITYNADLIARGGVPLVDNLEFKAPGSFFLSWAVFKFGERSVNALERFGVFWAVLAGIGVFVGGCLLFGLPGGMVAGLLYTLGAPITDSITVNYNSWMITAYIWTTVLFIVGLRRGGWGWFLASGALLAVAGLLKRQGGVVAPVFLIVLALGPLLQRPASWPTLDRRKTLLAFVGGMALGFLPITLFYLINSGFDGVFTLYKHFIFSDAGWKYVGGEVDWEGKLDRLEDGFLGFWEFMALPTLLASMTLVAVPLARQRGWTVVGVLLGGHLLLSCVGLALGFRFYMGYYLQVLPAACWLAGHSDGPLLRWFRLEQWPERPWHAASRLSAFACVIIACIPAVLADVPDLKKVHRHRKSFNSYQHEAERIAAMIKKNSAPTDAIWVWGRWAWPIYFHADRPSATRYYKVLGVITNNLDNTWKRPCSMTRFNNTGPWREIGAELKRRKPLFIVTANNESYIGWKPFQELLSSDYEPVPGFRARNFRFFHRKEHRMKGQKPRTAPAPRRNRPAVRPGKEARRRIQQQPRPLRKVDRRPKRGR